ncbi:MAG: hypothetical protein JXR91_14265 [Deltaproteobacteria bacterium]|nr:hypothetical protein [Deltaproteobacteria bacterium]
MNFKTKIKLQKRTLWILTTTILFAHIVFMADSCDYGEIKYKKISDSGDVNIDFGLNNYWLGFDPPVNSVIIKSSFGTVFKARCSDNKNCMIGIEQYVATDEYDDYYETDMTCASAVNSPDNFDYCDIPELENPPEDHFKQDNDIFEVTATRSDNTVSTFKYFKYYDYYDADWG